MPARSVVASLSGATLAVSASLPSTYDETGYGSLTFTAIGDIESFGNHGVRATVTEFTPVNTAVVAKVKGSKNYGTMTLVIGNIPSDAGQAILKSASESEQHYSFKLTYDDGVVHYLDALVTSFEYQDGAVNDVQKIVVELAICRKPVEVAAP